MEKGERERITGIEIPLVEVRLEPDQALTIAVSASSLGLLGWVEYVFSDGAAGPTGTITDQ
jgi:hypothetical protein